MDRNATILGGGFSPEYVFKLWNLIIRPPRAAYETSQLGPAEFICNGVRAARRDVTLKTARGTRLACSHFVPRQDRRAKDLKKFPVIIYLHGNSSSRLEAGNLVSAVIEQNISLFCFDASGCGLSDGEYVSLGWHERDDLATVIAHLRNSPFCGPIGIWGRSMGAVTALLHVDRDPTLGAICVDSPFASFRQLAEELAQGDRFAFPMPSWLVTAAMALIRGRVQTLANFDIEDLVPVEHAKNSHVPAIFLHGRQDTFIPPSHSRQLYECYAGDKELVTIDGDHNSERSAQVINHAVAFFKRALRLDEVDLSVPRHIVDEQCGLITDKDGKQHLVPPVPLSRAQLQKIPSPVRAPRRAPPTASQPPASKAKPVGGGGYTGKADAQSESNRKVAPRTRAAGGC